MSGFLWRIVVKWVLCLSSVSLKWPCCLPWWSSVTLNSVVFLCTNCPVQKKKITNIYKSLIVNNTNENGSFPSSEPRYSQSVILSCLLWDTRCVIHINGVKSGKNCVDDRGKKQIYVRRKRSIFICIIDSEWNDLSFMPLLYPTQNSPLDHHLKVLPLFCVRSSILSFHQLIYKQ
jgi:hypothetical protein